MAASSLYTNPNTGDVAFSTNISANNIGMFRNRIINGNMAIAQRGTSTTTAGKTYLIDRFATWTQIVTGTITTTQNTLTGSDAPYQNGFLYSYRATATVAATSYSYICPVQVIEGSHVSDLLWGTALGQSVTLSFWFRTNATGIHSITLRNTQASCSYNAAFTVSNSNTWQYLTFTIPAPPSGTTWSADANGGIEVYVAAINNNTKTAIIGWQVANATGLNSFVPGVNWPATTGNYIEFTGLQFEKGVVATPFEFRPYTIELQLCQRYYEVLTYGINGPNQSDGYGRTWWFYKIKKRAVPVLTQIGSTYTNIEYGVDHLVVYSVGAASNLGIGSNVNAEL